jgi:hypothetical protein
VQNYRIGDNNKPLTPESVLQKWAVTLCVLLQEHSAAVNHPSPTYQPQYLVIHVVIHLPVCTLLAQFAFAFLLAVYYDLFHLHIDLPPIFEFLHLTDGNYPQTLIECYLKYNILISSHKLFLYQLLYLFLLRLEDKIDLFILL